MGETPRVAELAISAAWHSGSISDRLATVDGIALEIVHRGTWSHGLGPDFRDALILFDGRELRAGSVEIHLRTRGWADHGHNTNPAYDAVVLHVVGRHDGAETRRHDGAIVPVAEIGPIDRIAIPELAAWDWDRVGGKSCAEGLASSRPRVVRDILFQLGDVRLAVRSARIESRLTTEPPGEILWGELLDGLGFAANREPMRSLARVAPLTSLEDLLQATRLTARTSLLQGILLGTAGFLPLAPSEAHLARLTPADVFELEGAWLAWGAPWRDECISALGWHRARVRPANHPVARLVAAANILATASERGGLLSTILDLVLEEDVPVSGLRGLTASPNNHGIGSDRSLDIIASGIIPFALALAAHSGDVSLGDAASRQWERLPAPAMNSVTRRAVRQVAGTELVGQIGARGAQGLIHLDTALCQPRRCFECPIAAAELSVNG